ncbi:EsaB/YukD family protein [Nocardioides sp. MH1]|uniref:EsaB/YukD family protein n=1 Tax=Nocardioides sp. MH1 TaxID=3242490 RepID=UPI003520669C
MPDRLLRVTVVAGRRRSDLAVPGGVALAELVPDLARAVGLLDPAAAYTGHRVHAHGQRLRPDRALGEQGVGDGALLVVTVGADDEPPPAYDDLAEATADVVDLQPRWSAQDTRRALRWSGVAMIAVALAIGLVGAAGRVAALLAEHLVDPAALAALGMVLAVLAGNALPSLAVAAGVGRVDRDRVDPALAQRLVLRSQRLLLIGTAVVGPSVLAAVTAVARSAAGAALGADCGLLLVLRARRQRARAPVVVDAAAGVATMLAAASTYAVGHGDARPALALTAGLMGLGATLLSRVPAPSAPLRARCGDLVETAALVALVPLLALATDLASRIGAA